MPSKKSPDSYFILPETAALGLGIELCEPVIEVVVSRGDLDVSTDGEGLVQSLKPQALADLEASSVLEDGLELQIGGACHQPTLLIIEVLELDIGEELPNPGDTARAGDASRRKNHSFGYHGGARIPLQH